MPERTDFASVDDYLAAQPPHVRAVLERVRATIRRALPGAAEGISYQIPIYKLDGVMVLYFAGFRGHYAIYPATARVVDALGEELAGRLHNKTIRFALDAAVPTRLIARVAKLRAAEAAELREARTAKKKAAKKKKGARSARTARAKLPKKTARAKLPKKTARAKLPKPKARA